MIKIEQSFLTLNSKSGKTRNTNLILSLKKTIKTINKEYI
jgi:hypothetical protein